MTIKHLFPPAWPTLDLNFAATRQLDPRITFTRASIGTYVDSRGIVQTAVDDEARFDHDPETRESLGLLIEESRTNYIQNSTDFNAGDWNFITAGTSPGIPVCTPNSGTAPDGTNTATRLVCDTGGGTTSGDVCYLRCNRDSSTRAVESMWIKSNTGSDQTIYMTTQQQPAIATNTWKRLLSLSNDFRVGARGDFSDQNIDILIWGAQVEDGDSSTGFSTSYIPTAGATATRAADLASITGTNFSSWYNLDAGTFTVDASYFGQTIDYKILIEGSLAGQGYKDFSWSLNNLSPLWQSWLPSIAKQIQLTGNVSLGESFKVAGSYGNGDLSAAFDGVVKTNSAPAESRSPAEFLVIGHRPSGANPYGFNGHFSRISYYPTRLTDAQLEALSS